VQYVPATLRDRGADNPFDRDYWLSHCEGYRVDTDEGRLGFVEAVLRGENPPRDTHLAVRAGRLGRRIVLVPISSVALHRAAGRAYLAAHFLTARKSIAALGREPAAKLL
jgi:hypothetical protein